jgi:hypothetical protein
MEIDCGGERCGWLRGRERGSGSCAYLLPWSPNRIIEMEGTIEAID